MNLQEEREKSRRYELAKMFAKGMLTYLLYTERAMPGHKRIAEEGVAYADALIAALKEDAK